MKKIYAKICSYDGNEILEEKSAKFKVNELLNNLSIDEYLP